MRAVRSQSARLNIKLSTFQSEQQVRYVADSNGYHSAVTVRSENRGTSGGAHGATGGAHDTTTGAHVTGAHSTSLTTAPSAQQQTNTQVIQSRYCILKHALS